MRERWTSHPPSTPGSGIGTTSDPDLDELRHLILGGELAQIAQLKRRQEDPDLRAEDLSQALSSEKIRRSLEQLMRAILKREPELVLEAIRPVLLEAVRKAVGDAFREFSESLNQIAEKSLSVRSFRWRFEAWRTGREFRDIMLSRSLLYSVREVFLIHGKTGVMLNRAGREAVTKDPDMISSMFSAIQEFVRDSFVGSENTELETIDAGSLKLWIQHGPFAMLAGAVEGRPPLELRGVFRDALTEIQKQFAAELTAFDGDVDAFEGTRPILNTCLLGGSLSKRRRPILPVLGAIACLALLAVWAYFGIAGYLRWHDYLRHLENQPGIVITRVERQGFGHKIFGLRDPLAPNPASLLEGSGIAASKVRFQLEPYQSLDPSFVARRRLAADRQMIDTSVIRFAQGQSELNDAALDQIQTIAETAASLFKEAAQTGRHLRILVTGHTDEVGSGESNIRLSAQRADRVRAELVANGIDGDALTTRGIGTSLPVRNGTSDRDRSFNRSVTLQVVE